MPPDKTRSTRCKTPCQTQTLVEELLRLGNIGGNGARVGASIGHHDGSALESLALVPNAISDKPSTLTDKQSLSL